MEAPLAEDNSGELSPEKERPGGLATAGKVFRVATAVTVFGIPLLVGTAAVIGWGVHGAYKYLTRR
jgi:hypothetical protein